MVGVLIVTHNGIGDEMLKTAETFVGKRLPEARSIAIPGNLEPDQLGGYADRIRQAIDTLDRGGGVLILTDLLGATPSNLAHYFANDHMVKIISGLNLPMLIRVINYADRDLDDLARAGIQGANRGITLESDL
jgi:PTS system ascorbate-specific IIA component